MDERHVIVAEVDMVQNRANNEVRFTDPMSSEDVRRYLDEVIAGGQPSFVKVRPGSLVVWHGDDQVMILERPAGFRFYDRVTRLSICRVDQTPRQST